MPYYLDRDPERNIVVVKVNINGYEYYQPFYETTGHNSKLKGCWLPFIMMRGIYDLTSYNLSALPKIYDAELEKLSDWVERNNSGDSPAYLIKTKSEYIKEDILKTEGIYLDKDKKLTEVETLIKKRLILKQFLIVSSQLSPGFFSDEQLKNSGLSDDEITIARKPLDLKIDFSAQDIPSLNINKWMQNQGASYIKDMMYTTDPKKRGGLFS